MAGLHLAEKAEIGDWSEHRETTKIWLVCTENRNAYHREEQREHMTLQNYTKKWHPTAYSLHL